MDKKTSLKSSQLLNRSGNFDVLVDLEPYHPLYFKKEDKKKLIFCPLSTITDNYNYNYRQTHEQTDMATL